jgi:exodeoxyribonuclease V gamma subunit
LRGFIDHLALTASGLRADADHAITVVAGSGETDHHSLAAWSRDAAQEFLGTLLTDMLTASHDYLLPCEAVFEWRDEPSLEIASIVDRLRENTHSDLSSRYGPVSRLEDFEAPAPAAASAMIARRFGKFFESLDGDEHDD